MSEPITESQEAGRQIAHFRRVIRRVQDNLMVDFKAGKISRDVLGRAMTGAEKHYEAEIARYRDILWRREETV